MLANAEWVIMHCLLLTISLTFWNGLTIKSYLYCYVKFYKLL